MLHQVGEHVEEFVPRLPQTEHQSALRFHIGKQPFGVGEQSQGPGVDALATADGPVEPGHRLGVVVEDVGPRLHQPLERSGLVEEIGHEHLDGRPRRRADRLDRPPEVLSAAVGQVIAGHARDHHVLQPQSPRRLGHPLRLVEFQRLGLPLGHRAESAGPRADVAQDHERGRPLRPAFEAVGALRRGADRFEFELRDQVGRLRMTAPRREILPQPGRQAARRWQRDGRLRGRQDWQDNRGRGQRRFTRHG